MKHLRTVREWIQSLNLATLRVRRPEPFFFLCGGKESPSQERILSLRDYLLKRSGSQRILSGARLVLAEAATDLYADSGYRDLISFEEHIAQLSDLVIVISESPGSLAELGAFSMNQIIRERLLVILRKDHYESPSFIKYGPVRLLETYDDEKVASFPWRTRRDLSLIKRTVRGIYPDIIETINNGLRSRPISEKYDNELLSHRIIVIFWIIFVLRAATTQEISHLLNAFSITMKTPELQKSLYCMRVSGWIRYKKYGHYTFYYPTVDNDPFNYSYLHNVTNKEHSRWKTDIQRDLRRLRKERPQRVLEQVSGGFNEHISS